MKSNYKNKSFLQEPEVKPNPFRVQKYTIGSLRARQIKYVQNQRLKAMNAEMRKIKSDYQNYTKAPFPSVKTIESMYKEKKKHETGIEQYEEYIYDKKKWESVKDVSEIVLSNYVVGNYNVIDKTVPKTVYIKGHYL
jgi:hypothetical protein